MLTIALLEPEIPPNTGNIIRLCANTGAALHLIKPLQFELSDARLKRAGLDYHEFAQIHTHDNYHAFATSFASHRIFYCSTKAQLNYTDVAYQENDVFLFGPETRGLPEDLLQLHPAHAIRIPMKAHSRSLNLSNAAAIILYEALRQLNFTSIYSNPV